MSKWDKRLARIRQNPKNVRFKDIETVLLRLGFKKRQESTSHAIFTLGVHRITIQKPHGTPFLKEVYVKKEILPTLEEMGVFEEE